MGGTHGRVALLAAVVAAVGLMATVSVGARGVEGVPDDIAAWLETRKSIEVRAASAQDIAESEMNAEDAVAIAAREAVFVWNEPRSVTAYLVRFTDPQHGTIAEDGDGDVVPLYVDKLAWLVVMRDADVPLFGPPRSHDGPATYRTTVVHFLDAVTRDWLFAIA